MYNVVTRPPQVYIVAPALLCWGIERLVQGAHPHMEVAGASALLSDAIPALERGEIDVLLLASEGGIPSEQLGALQAYSGTRVVLVAWSASEEVLDSAVLAGIRGIVRIGDPAQHLVKAIERVHGGELWIDRAAPGRIFMHIARQNAAHANDPERLKIASLTSRERQTIAAITSNAGAPGKVIASRLCISEHTLRNHLSSIYAKLGLNNRVDLFAYATRNQLQQYSSQSAPKS